MGVQKSKSSSVHKYTRLFFKRIKSKKYLFISRNFNNYKYFVNFAHLVNLLLEYLFCFKYTSLFEFFIQVIVIYNLIQIFKQVNFFYMLAYFINFTVFVGLSMILCDLDLGAIILWVIYGGVIIIFFLYATMWSEIMKSFLRFFDYQMFYYLSFIFVMYYFINLIIEYEFLIQVWHLRYFQVYSLLADDTYEELETLGASFFFFSLFYFILSTVALVVSCICVVVIIINLKKFKAHSFVSYLSLSKNNVALFQVLLLKNQHFFNQEYDSTYLRNSFTKVFKISVKFHRNKLNYRRV